MTPQFESLHNHTHISDGTQTHAEVMATAEKYGVGTIAFTDHDSVPDFATIKYLRDYTGPLKWIMGVELSSALPREMEDWDQSSLHILGLFINPHAVPIVEYCAQVRAGRIERMKFVVGHLVSLGFNISSQDCLDMAGESQVGQPHIVRAVLAKHENVGLMEKLREEMEEASRVDPEVKVQYDRMMSDGERQYPYVLFMGSRSFKPLAKQSFKNVIDLDSTVAMIHEAGGVAILAHWFFDNEKLPIEKLAELLRTKRVDGVEVSSVDGLASAFSSNFIQPLRDVATETNTLGLVASDSHSIKDFAQFAASPLAQESIGQTARLIDRFQPNLEWSNLK